MSRPILVRQPGILFNVPLSNEHTCANRCYGCLYPCSCRCNDDVNKALTQSTYIHILSNRIEYNYPYSTCDADTPCCWRIKCNIIDRVHVIHFDRDVFHHVSVASCCSPCGSWFSSHWGLGEAVVLSAEQEACSCECDEIKLENNKTDVPRFGCCVRTPMVLLPYVSDAEQVVSMIYKIRMEHMCEIHMIR